MIEALKVDFPNFVYSTNETKPRSGSFEITFNKQNESESNFNIMFKNKILTKENLI